MFILYTKLGNVKHKDKNGIEWKRTYHEGDLIPANEVDICSDTSDVRETGCR